MATTTTKPVREHELLREKLNNRDEIWRVIERDDLDNGGAIERHLECISERSLERGLAWAYCATLDPSIPVNKARGLIGIVTAYLIGLNHLFTDVAVPSVSRPLPVKA